ncbi:PBSX family phage terminase large subunit [Clostridium botulinum]|uniref:Phage terminase, large subunit, PBSX family n=1 Tax=Clostridium botulinum CFSAN001627 TaxID=1232189 RepID=M2A029_CLOBO|nr:PBSX family phage terminase large subunit [Clostridium botulinum]EKN43375.1 phage terminase, large subunit, PBSX family [Clostridium botulinum CFSAN001627]MBY6850391.1 PBSX family phage terminase large subunit [Clostridium botulinum]MBY6857451.1 PBSX family phage terminase large subunit [Clostridium botulinum]MBY6967421.1 PBSX family phage terminase large subunit [Clostridium botulinum]
MAVIKLSKVIGKGYKDFWSCTKRYRVCKGGRGSKKSTTTALNIIYRMMKYPKTNTLVIRKTFASHKDSTYAQLKWAITQLKVNHLWEYTKSPLEITYKPTGQKILFRGLDDPLKITSITVEVGYLCWCWFEEAYEITNEEDFNKIDMSIRGELPKGLFKQITITFNPWNERHWLKKRFFDNEDDEILAMTTNYKCNEFLGKDDIKIFEKMKETSQRRYSIEGLGNWGIAEGVIFDNWQEKEFDYKEIAKRPEVIATNGLDFGYKADPTAFIGSLVDKEKKEIYIYAEHYQKGMLNNEIADIIKYKGFAKEQIIADSAEQKSIEEIKRDGIGRIKPARKGKDSIINGIQYLLQYKIYVHPKCQNTQIELYNYVWDKNKEGKQLNKPIDDYNHLLDALRYSMEPLQENKRFRAVWC